MYKNEICPNNCPCHSMYGHFHCFSGPCCSDSGKITNPEILQEIELIINFAKQGDMRSVLRTAQRINEKQNIIAGIIHV